MATVKAALNALGLPGGEPRPPLPGLAAEEQAAVREIVAGIAAGAAP